MKIKKSCITVLSICLMVFQSSTLWALELISPPQNTEVHPGDTITIKVEPSPGEKVGRVFFGGFGTEVTAPPYEYQYKIGPHNIGDIKFTIFAIKPDSEGPFASPDAQFSSSIELHLKSTLPPTVTLQGIRIRNDQKSLFMETDNKRKIKVYGQYTDGIERDVSSSATGTTYTSSDEKIAIVDSNGLVTAVGPGTAKITIKNGKYEITVKVDVKAKK